MPRSIVRLVLSSALALAATACVACTDEVRATVPPSTDPVPMEAGIYPLRFVSNGDQRAYLLYLPADHEDDRSVHAPYPLVAMFHGYGGSAFGFAAMLAMTGLRTLADTQGKIIVFLQGTNGEWRMTNVVRDDVLYTQELLDYLAGKINVDVTRVFAAGHSLGGRFVHELGTSDPERFRAIADVSGFYGTTIGQPAAPPTGTLLPVLIVHGVLDLTVPPEGGRRSRECGVSRPPLAGGPHRPRGGAVGLLDV